MAQAIARKDISPIVKKGSILIKQGKFGILEGYTEKQRIEVEVNGQTLSPPNFYPWEEICAMKSYWKVDI